MTKAEEESSSCKLKTDGVSTDTKIENIDGESSASILESFSKFNFDATSSLLPAKPIGSNDGKISIYPADSFPPISAFEVSAKFPALITPVRRTHELRKKLKSIMLSRPRLSVVVELTNSDLDHDDDEKGFLSSDKNFKLSQDNRKMYRKIVLDAQKAGLNNCKDRNSNIHHDLKVLLEEEPQSFRLGSHTIVLSYQDWTVEEVLGRLLLPEGVKEIPSAFEAVGHLAHVNLREELLPYKYLVGKVLLDKNSPRIRTVVNKLGSIDNKYRTFGMEVIAGNSSDGDKNSKSWSDVLVKEEGCEYRLDFRKVYWNSRLGGEHRRLVKLIRKDALTRAQKERSEPSDGGDTNDKGERETKRNTLVVADLMAGIGPFAIPLTARTNETHKADRGDTKKNKRKNHATDNAPPFPVVVYANDLNPCSYEFLVANAKRNKCDFIANRDSLDSNGKDNKHKLYAYNMDARSFCHLLQDQKIFPDHCIMNLPAMAIEFLDAFRGYPRATSGEDSVKNDDDLPRIHVHCFAPRDVQVAKLEIWKRVEASLGCPLDENSDEVVIHPVRDVAPNKNMYCVSFKLPTAVSSLPRMQMEFDQQDDLERKEVMTKEVVEPDPKRIKTNE
eukprot:CAMPEP_0197194180 /NCGR_PEP_ID=MMETSP1423-20130617/28759_1 /TAXON_ID=476441 /ORGANISM="Pseudo-nitzschia heimii, Strain UNC1101" /LENGTH=613 /DNA_ID=CAMNT_0042647557 /DNA_START=56 /DNA_END=1897 /DNA_ORIENTATION=-